LLLISTVALAVAVSGTLLRTWTILDREVERGYAATRPPAATLWLDAVDEELAAVAAAVPGVAVVDARRVVTVRIKVGPIVWRPLQVIVPRDFADLRLARFRPQRGAWPPAPGEILLERDALGVARAQIGDLVTVRSDAGSEVALRVAGIVHDPGQAQARMEDLVYAYAEPATLATLGAAPGLDRLLIGVAPPADTREVVARVASRLEGLGHRVRRTQVEQGHPHASLMATLLRVQVGFVALSLLLCGVLVFHLFTIQTAADVRRIGLLQAVGARRQQVAGLYFAGAGMLGGFALGLAWPLVRCGARTLSGLGADYLNFDLASTSVPLWVVATEVAVALILPTASAAWPVWRATRVPVREALAEHGVRGTFGRGLLDRLVGRAGGRLSRPLLLSLRNAVRQRRRAVLTLTALVLGGVCLLAAFDLRASLAATLDSLFATRRHHLALSLGSMQPLANVQRAARATPGVRVVEGWIVTQARLVDGERAPTTAPGVLGHAGGHGAGHGTASGEVASRFTVLAPPAATTLHVPDIVRGRGLLPDDVDGLIVNDSLAAQRPGLAVGSELRLQMGPQEKAWTVVGIAREPFTPPTAYVPLAYFERAGHAGTVNAVRLALAETDREAIEVLAADLERNLEREGVRARGRQSTGDSRFAFDQHFVMFYDCLLAIAALLLAVAAAGLGATLVLGLHERRRELGVLRVLGASSRSVALLVLVEACSIAVAGWGVAVVVATPLMRAAGDLLLARGFGTEMLFVAQPGARLLWLGAALAVAVVASLLPAWRASRLSVREMLASA